MSEQILIVDDDMNFVNMIGRRLKAADYDIIVAFDAISATRQALEHRPDLVILDLKLPAGGGYKVYQRLKTLVDTTLIPILFVTGYSGSDIPDMNRIEHLEEHLLTKPFTAEDLLNKVEETLKAEGDEFIPSPAETNREFAGAS